MVAAICKEIELKKDFFNNDTIETIYFGGGTPSLLTETQINKIFESIHTHFSLIKNLEITLEANPDDINPAKTQQFLKQHINRLSIGIQSFNTSVLRWMNRTHDAKQAKYAVKMIQDFGFKNINVDLIYAIPEFQKSSFNYSFENDLKNFIELNVSHISAYNLTIEPKTTFGNWQKNKIITQIDDNTANNQFDFLISEMAKKNFEQYEISNFCQSQKFAKHNTAYWFGKKYLGVGPSAHSFNGTTRFANVSHNANYISALANQTTYQKIEILTKTDIVNEHLLTRLRTKWGASIDFIAQHLQKNDFENFIKTLENEVSKKNIIVLDNCIFLLIMVKKLQII